jgi:hypothetical protein
MQTHPADSGTLTPATRIPSQKRAVYGTASLQSLVATLCKTKLEMTAAHRLL